ncbi:hypothetical protein EXE48_03650 [Halorubrum sp. ASP1]|jgi:hypothetical protein|uniref:DUF7562 family protein n=1 Tax=Halorubrum sp. ASP1 TaxID=2518114 RepID=UPI0010F85FB1|nr:hypothetical protein [Halorubrum sp. ASP1]TKX62873.1 hypothetical protein EXE48_03650 [Halorubrum sp. ASP1]
MWGSRGSRDRRTVVCIACGDSVLREDAREYDKEGDRWSRRDKEFEYLCADCDDEICHQPRDGLESLLRSIEADGLSDEEFLGRYVDAVADDGGRSGEGDAGARSDRGRSDRTRSDRDRSDRDR